LWLKLVRNFSQLGVLGIIIRPFSFRKLHSTLFHRFSAVNYDSVLSFFSARQVSEIILNKSSELRIRIILETCKLPGISYFSDVLEKFQNQFWKQHFLSKKSRILWILGNILLYLFEITQLEHFQCFWKVHWGRWGNLTCWEKTKYGLIISSRKVHEKKLILARGKNSAG
jgi:hypothetical protein